MKHSGRHTLIAAGSALALAMLSGPVSSDPDEKLAIEDRLQQYQARFNEADAAALAQLFDENVAYFGV